MPNPTIQNVQTQNNGGVKSTIKSILRGLLMIIVIQFVLRQVVEKKKGSTSSSFSQDAVKNIRDNQDTSSYLSKHNGPNTDMITNHIPYKIAPIWPEDALLDIITVISPSLIPEQISKTSKNRIVINETSFHLGNYSDKRVIDVSFEIPPEIQKNGTIWGHFYIGISGENIDPSSINYNPERSFYFSWPLTQFLLQKKLKKTKNLLAKSSQNENLIEDKFSDPTIVSHYHPNFTMSFIPNIGILDFKNIQPAMRQYFHLYTGSTKEFQGENDWYYPVLFINTFWQLRSQMITLDSTINRLPLHIDLNNIANWKFGLISSLDEGAKQAARASAQGSPIPGGGDGSELEMIKEILLETNPYLLGTTITVSIIHMIFEILAFKSDINHYRNKKNNVGISIRSILANVLMQIVILLYLLDNNENTSWMILISQGMGILLELWKITTIVNVRVLPSNNVVGFRVALEDKHTLSITEEKTKEYDAMAFKYLYMLAVPLLLAYSGYSLMYETHKSWYSFIIATLVGSVYAYGFLMMIPSLYINYRLKSVAHMPAKAMTYKFLNTFIDDLFAFTIKMPILHRLATFRDDVIFFIYIYQSWRYRTDYTRVNEFGQGGEQAEANSTNSLDMLSCEIDKDLKICDKES